MARRTTAQKLETLVLSTMKKGRGYKLYDYVRKDYGAVQNLAQELWSGYRAGDVSTRTMFHLRTWTHDPAAFDLGDLIALANATVQEFPDGFVTEKGMRNIIWSDVPGLCDATGRALEIWLAANPGAGAQAAARLDEFVEPARSAAAYTLAKLGAAEGGADEALAHDVRKEVREDFSNLSPPDSSNWTKEQWHEALRRASLDAELSLIKSFKLALFLMNTCDVEDVPTLLAKFTGFASETPQIIDAAVGRGAGIRAGVEAALASLPDDAWNLPTFKLPSPGLYLSMVTLELCHAAGEPPREEVTPALVRFARLYTCNWFADTTRREFLERVQSRLRLLPRELLSEALYGDGSACRWDTVATLPSEGSAKLAAAKLEGMTGDPFTDSLNMDTELLRAVDAFAALGEFTGPALEPMIERGDVTARGRVVTMLTASPHAASASPLARALHDSSKKIRQIAIDGLGAIEPGAVAEALEGVLSTGKKDARLAAAMVLAGHSPHPSARALAASHLAGKERSAEIKAILQSV